MPRHIFDTNILRNFGLCSAEHVLAQTCSGTLYWSGIVKDELTKGPPAFARVHQLELNRGDTDRAQQLATFQRLAASLEQQGFVNLRLNTSARHAEALAFFACCLDEEEMDPGEAESFALAAYRGLTFYTDDLHAYNAITRYNEGMFRCPPYGVALPPYEVVEVHSTPWLLIEAVRQGHLTSMLAEALFREIKQVWYRHPKRSLEELRALPDSYW